VAGGDDRRREQGGMDAAGEGLNQHGALVGHVVTDIRAHLQRTGERRPVREIEVIRPVFYQMTRAYVVGKVKGDGYTLPLTIAFRNGERGVLVDAVMLKESDISVLFSFTRSYFHVDLERVGEAVLFLKSIMPRKPVSELFTVLGRAKQGKTERFREIFRHLDETDDQFVMAPGEKGMVMACFTLQSFDVVFKVIRDRFPAVKNVLREEIMAKYDLVFKHDRAGRLVDAQEFKRVRFPRARFDQEVLDELLDECANTAHVEDDAIIVDHVYIERKMTPLNLYLRSATQEQGELAVIEYGQAIRDLVQQGRIANFAQAGGSLRAIELRKADEPQLLMLRLESGEQEAGLQGHDQDTEQILFGLDGYGIGDHRWLRGVVHLQERLLAAQRGQHHVENGVTVRPDLLRLDAE